MSWFTFIFICGTVASTCASSDKDSLLVRISSGDVRGYRDPDGDIFAFYEIPYATAPTGPSRFKAPLPPPVWTKPLDAINKNIICPQPDIMPNFLDNKTIQENCLLANIFVPDTKDENLPVLVIVHGGGFQGGFGNMVTAKNLIRTKKLIIVTFNYRVNLHGFLCLGTNDVPGNAGMKDQVALLRWVQRNIGNFGGNPNEVTIHGYSAGSASVDLLLMSESARGLFNKVIADSGSHLATFTVQRDPLEIAKQYAKGLDPTINVDDLYDLEEFYKTTSYEELMKDTNAIMNRTDSTFVFSPCVERGTTEEIFLDDDPFNILKTGKYLKVPLLYGFASMEGLIQISYFETWKTKMNDNFADFLPANLQFDSNSEKEKVAKSVKEFYFGDEPISDGNILSYVNYMSDVLFAYSILRSVRLQVEGGHNKIYLYEFSFVDDSVPVIPHTDVRGADHCTQTYTVLDANLHFMPENKSNLTEELKKMKSVVRELWSNFIITGTPVPKGSSLPEWPPVDGNWSPHMSLGQTVDLKGSLLEDRTRFWDNIYDKYYRPAIPPPTPPIKHGEL